MIGISVKIETTGISCRVYLADCAGNLPIKHGVPHNARNDAIPDDGSGSVVPRFTRSAMSSPAVLARRRQRHSNLVAMKGSACGS